MRRIGLDRAKPRPACIVECVDQRGIAAECLGRRDILDAVALPQPVGPAEGRKAALGRHARAGQDDDVAHFHALA